jgi:hypothetical protein
MHLLDTYALRTGSKIGKPFIIKKFFPLPVEKYITIQNSSGMPAKCYDYFQEVISFFKNKLDKFNYRIVQIGSKDDKILNGVINLCGQTNINQTAFILSNSKFHISNDSFSIHMASAFEIPSVGLYSITYPSIAGPYWNKNNSITLTPENHKASFNPNENPKTINSIKIETVINAINNLLFKEENAETSFQTKFIGNRYGNNVLETFSDQILPPNIFPNQMVNIRVDYKKDNLSENDYISILNNLNIRPCSIITDKKIDVKPFLQFKERLTQLIYNITESIDIEFINDLINFNINTILVFEKNDNEEILNNRKFTLIEHPFLIQEIKNVDKSIIQNLQKEKNLFYTTKKILYANQNIYSSRHAFNKNILLKNNFELFDIPLKPEDIELLGQELDEFFIYTK